MLRSAFVLPSAVVLALAVTVPAAWSADSEPKAESRTGSSSSSSNYVSAKPAKNKLAKKTPAPDAKQAIETDQRQSRYQDGVAAAKVTEPSATQAEDKVGNEGSGGVAYRDEQKIVTTTLKSVGTPIAAGTQKAEPSRPATVVLRSSSYGFRLWDAGRDMITDIDADGYYRRFEIRFDADVTSGDALVYAKLYLRRVGDSGPWEHYYSTADFWIYGGSDTDDYYVETTLNDGYPTAEYDVLIDLYESGYSGIVATIGPFEDSSLRDLRLEDAGLDIPVPNAGYHIDDVDTTLLTDADRDGYYSRFTVAFNPDRDYGAAMAYAVLRVRAEGGDWQTEHTSAVFQVDETGDADRYSFTGDWLSGYPTSRYDVQIDLYDAGTNLLVATVSSERAELSRVPLEDATRDTTPNPGGGGGGGDSDSDGSGGGGSMTVMLLGLAAGLLFARWRLQRDRLLQKARLKGERQ